MKVHELSRCNMRLTLTPLHGMIYNGKKIRSKRISLVSRDSEGGPCDSEQRPNK